MENENKQNNNANDGNMVDLDIKIKALELELTNTKNILDETIKDLHMCQGRLSEIREEKEDLNSRLRELELMKMDLKLLDIQKIKDENNKIQHRIHVTKKLLDEARDDLKFNAMVIKDLEEQKVLDKIRGKNPDSLIVYRNK